MKPNALALLALFAAIISLLWAAYLHFGRTALSLDHLRVEQLSAGSVVVETGGQELVLLSKSSVTGGGALALLDSKGSQALLASDGVLALRGSAPELHRTLVSKIRGWSLILAATPESSTIAMKGVDTYDVVIEAGKTLDDPLDIRGGRINVRSGPTAAKLGATGVNAAPPRKW